MSHQGRDDTGPAGKVNVDVSLGKSSSNPYAGDGHARKLALRFSLLIPEAAARLGSHARGRGNFRLVGGGPAQKTRIPPLRKGRSTANQDQRNKDQDDGEHQGHIGRFFALKIDFQRKSTGYSGKGTRKSNGCAELSQRTREGQRRRRHQSWDHQRQGDRPQRPRRRCTQRTRNAFLIETASTQCTFK